MADNPPQYLHLLVADRSEARDFHRQGRGDTKIRDVERRNHGTRLAGEAAQALVAQDTLRAAIAAEFASVGVVITIDGARGFKLALDSLEQRSNHHAGPHPKWLLLGVTPETDTALERATVWVSDEYRDAFLRLFSDYLEREAPNSDHPKNRQLVANMSRIQATVLSDLWQSDGPPPTTGRQWWELWLRPTEDAIELVERYAAANQLTITSSRLRFDSRHVIWVRARWDDLLALPFTAVPITEIRRPQFVDTVEDLDDVEQLELAGDLAQRVIAADDDAPAVCLLDSGVHATHELLQASISATDIHTVVPPPITDRLGHGTQMAGLALFGPLDHLLLSSATIRLRHRLESVKYLPDTNAPVHDPDSYGVVTAQAVALPEDASDRQRVYCLTITAPADRPGEPSLWSAAVDALAAGTDIGRSERGIDLLGPPDPAAARLILVSAGNVDPPYQADYLQHCELSPIEDPAQAWNVLTVAASTALIDTPNDPSFHGWSALGAAGGISPHSRTGLTAGGPQWPIKPDICMEGGNVLTDATGVDFHERHSLLSLRTTAHRNDLAIASANATSAATAQAARLAAMAMATYPSYWPETIRGLMTHHAQWTESMRAEIDAEASKRQRRQLLRRFGWGVPDTDGVLNSSANAVTMVVQDEFVPFSGPEYKMRQFRLHQLPWPSETLADLGPANVELRVTLSYFIEPSAARRGWRRRYAYASHGLRFDLRSPDETTAEFVRRVNREAATEEDEGISRPSSSSDRWTIGPDQRHKGSLHQDVWSGYGAELARTGGVLAVNAVGGWWKNSSRKDRVDRPVRYALVVSLRTRAENIDLYTPIATTLRVPVEATLIPM